jgi:hypothetical protein
VDNEDGVSELNDAPEAEGADEANAVEAADDSSSSSSDSNIKAPQGIIIMPAPEPEKPKHRAPQNAIDDFWAKFEAKHPGKGAAHIF